MRFKPIPDPPDDIGPVMERWRSVPLVPQREEDCLLRLEQNWTTTREQGIAWLTFLRALDLVERGPSGVRRTTKRFEPETLGPTFRIRVYGVDEVIRVLEASERPMEVDEVFDAVERHVPQWERYRNPGSWEGIWLERTGRILEWAVLFDLVERSDGAVRAHGPYRVDSSTADRNVID